MFWSQVHQKEAGPHGRSLRSTNGSCFISITAILFYYLRVKAAVPMVLDCLNMEEIFLEWYRNNGAWSFALGPYWDEARFSNFYARTIKSSEISSIRKILKFWTIVYLNLLFEFPFRRLLSHLNEPH